ncbi:hypothetical protein DMC01_02955, partial [Campylobacter troglodytis]
MKAAHSSLITSKHSFIITKAYIKEGLEELLVCECEGFYESMQAEFLGFEGLNSNSTAKALNGLNPLYNNPNGLNPLDSNLKALNPLDNSLNAFNPIDKNLNGLNPLDSNLNASKPNNALNPSSLINELALLKITSSLQDLNQMPLNSSLNALNSQTTGPLNSQSENEEGLNSQETNFLNSNTELNSNLNSQNTGSNEGLQGLNSSTSPLNSQTKSFKAIISKIQYLGVTQSPIQNENSLNSKELGSALQEG